MNKLFASLFTFFGILIFVFPVMSAPNEVALESQARERLTKLFAALASGNPEKIEPLLAPEFQLVRADGSAYNKAEYLKKSIPKIVTTPEFTDLVVTRHGDSVVVRLKLIVREFINGHEVESGSEQLIVFRIEANTWKVVASANLAKPI